MNYPKIQPGHPAYQHVQDALKAGVPTCDSANHNTGCTNPYCPVWGYMGFKKGDRVRLNERTIPPGHPWRKPYNGRFGRNWPAATHGVIHGLCPKQPGYVRFKPDNRKTVQTIRAENLELDPGRSASVKPKAVLNQPDSARMVCGIVAVLRAIAGTSVEHQWVNWPQKPALEMGTYLRRILDRHVTTDSRLSDPYSTSAVMVVRDKRVGNNYSKAMDIVARRRLPVVQEWWPHGSRRIAPKASDEAG